jgi:hypothetical protein
VLTATAPRLVDPALAWPGRPLILTRPDDADAAAFALATGGVVAHGFGNFYVITTRPDADIVRSVNLMKGRPPQQTGSITTTPARVPLVFDWDRLPTGITRRQVMGLMDDFFAMGPFGFRGPAAEHVPDHLGEWDNGVRTTQVIAPGHACPSNDFLSRSLAAIDDDILYITSANRSRHLTGAEDEPAHYKADGIRAEFGDNAGFLVLEHVDEAAARASYPLHAPMSTTILGFHKLGQLDGAGRPSLIVERHGSLPIEQVVPIVERHGFGMTLGPKAVRRLQLRRY